MRKIALIGAMGVGALGLVGIGTGASFTDSVSATQKVTAGHMDMQVSGPADSTTNGKTVSFKDTAPLASTFTTGAQHVIITNNGNIDVNAWRVSVSHTTLGAAAPSGALANELYVKLTSNDPHNGAQTLFDGKLSDLEKSPLSVTGPLAPKATDDLAVEFYAGSGNAPSLNNDAQNGQIVPTVTVDYIG